MKEKKDCKIVQDLLPSYIDGLTNEETNQFIKEHMKDCDECLKVLEDMEKELKQDKKKVSKQEVAYMKKYKRKMTVLKVIIGIIILGFVLIIGRRTAIMVSLSNKAKNAILSDNYYARLQSYQGNTLVITESYNKGDNYCTTMNYYSNQYQDRKLIFYKNGEEKIVVSEYEGEKYQLDAEHMIDGKIGPVTYVSEGFFANLQYALLVGIRTTYCNGKECYVLLGDGYERYIDKETGLAVRTIEKSTKEYNRETDWVVDYEYQFNTVEDSHLVKPDVSQYQKLQQ